MSEPPPSPRRRSSGATASRAAVSAVMATLGRPLRAVTRWEASPRRPGPVRAAVGRPGTVALAAGLVVFIASAVHLHRFELAPGTDGASQVVARPDAAPPADGPPGEIGPRRGEDLVAYERSRRQRLEELDGDQRIRAVVSFADYLEGDALGLGDDLAVELLLLRLPLLGEEPLEVALEGRDPAGAIEAVARRERDRLAEEEGELASTLASDVGDEAFAEEFERRLEEVAEVRGTLADDPALMYGVVVVGPVEALRELDRDPGVRLVDPGADPAETRPTRFFGLLPEDEARASQGRAP